MHPKKAYIEVLGVYGVGLAVKFHSFLTSRESHAPWP